MQGHKKYPGLKKRIKEKLSLYRRLNQGLILKISRILGILSWIMATLCIAGVAMYAGFDHNPHDGQVLRQWLRIPQTVFAINIIFGLIFRERKGRRRGYTIAAIVTDIGVLLTMIPWIYPCPGHPWLPQLCEVLYSPIFLYGVLTAYSILEISRAVMSIPGKHTSPALMLASSFLFFIIAGSLLLMLPNCRTGTLSYIDSLFVSTSAVCITGLTPVDVPSTFTPMGLGLIVALMQIGGVGVLTVTSFFALSYTGSSSILGQLMIRDMVYSKTMNSLIPTMLYILGFTVAIETVGAIAIYFTIPPELYPEIGERIGVSIFHSVSSFCNSGFSCIPGGMANGMLLHGNQSIYLVTSGLVFAGILGFPILVDLKDSVKEKIIRFRNRVLHRGKEMERVRLYNINTRLVMMTSVILLAIGTVSFFILEYDNTLKGMSFGEKMAQSLFNALTPRSAGFISVNPAQFLPLTMLVVVVQMWIGGASQSLGGGIKVNTLAVMWLQVRTIIRGGSEPTAYNRRISRVSVNRAFAVFFLSIAAFLVFAVLILAFEPELPVKDCLFEVVSALFSVGSSLGITSSLSEVSKTVLCIAMFVGRLGILSLLCGFFAKRRPDMAAHLPEENVIMN